jgi:plastocyanin domain-containing protein
MMSSDKWLVLLGGLASIGWVNWYFFSARRGSAVAKAGATGIQETVVTVLGGYSPAEIRVRAGRPVRIVFDRQETNPCSEEVVVPDFSIRRFLPPHQRTSIEFTPLQPGSHDFSCGMGMLHGRVIVE